MSLNRRQQLDYTQRYQIRSGRVNFADYVQRRQLVQDGLLLGLNLYPPDHDQSIIPIIKEGEVNTTPEELETYLTAVRQVENTSTIIPVSIGGSLSFDYTYGLNGSHVSYPNNSGLAIGNQSFTIEWYQYWINGADYPRLFSIGTFVDGNNDIAVSYEPDFYFWKNGSPNNVGVILPYNTWTHIAIVGISGVGIDIYQDGTLLNNIAGAYNFTNTTSALTIGNESDPQQIANYTGQITNFRWVVGTAVYTSNFTPPTAPLNAISGTQLLLLATDNTNLIKDSSSANRTPTNTGVTFSSTTPF